MRKMAQIYSKSHKIGLSAVSEHKTRDSHPGLQTETDIVDLLYGCHLFAGTPPGAGAQFVYITTCYKDVGLFRLDFG